MPAPATTGQLRTKVSEMKIGDYIKCAMVVDPKVALSYLGTVDSLPSSNIVTTEIPPSGLTFTSSISTACGFFYFVKVGRGLLVADRVCFVGTHTSASWMSLNTNNFIHGVPFTTDESITGIIRSLTGGVAYLDRNGDMSTTASTHIGGWPSNNEWDKFIVNFPPMFIQPEKTLNDVFHWSGLSTWTQNTPLIRNVTTEQSDYTYFLPTNDQRIVRGNQSSTQFSYTLSSSTLANTGFRPVFDYQD